MGKKIFKREKYGAIFDAHVHTYFDFSRKYHPDKINAAPDSTVMMKANEVFAQINKAFEVLSDQDKKNDYDIRGYKDASEVEDAPAEKGKNARELYLKANRFFKVKKYFEAVSLLEQAVEIDQSRANYYLLLGLSQAKLPAMKQFAEKNLLKATELEPWNADHVFALGELYRSENLMKKADQYFKKALEINMEHTLAGQAVKDLGLKFDGVNKPPSEKRYYSLAYSKFTVPLVKAVQQLSEKDDLHQETIENLQKENSELKETLKQVLKRLDSLETK